MFLGLFLTIITLLFIFPNFFLKEMRPWKPPVDKGFVGPFKKNNLLKHVVYGLKGLINGPEDVAVDSLGRVYVGLESGKIVRLGKDK